MKTIKIVCDICATEIAEDQCIKHSIESIPGSFEFGPNEHREPWDFTFKIGVESFLFNMTNKHFCRKCIVKACIEALERIRNEAI